MAEPPPGPVELSGLRETLDFARTEVVPEIKTEEHAMRLALYPAVFAHATSTFEAVIVLCERGLAPQAMMLNRALFEQMVDLHWVRANPELAEQRFVEHARLNQHRRREAARHHPGIVPEPAAPQEELPPDEVNALKKLFAAGGESWTGVRLDRRVEAIEGQWGDESERRVLRFMHDVVNRLNNDELHPSSWSLARRLRKRRDENGDDRLQFRTELEAELADAVMGPSLWIYACTVALILEVFDIPLAERLGEIGDRASRSFSPAAGAD